MDHQLQAPLTATIQAIRSRAERIRQQELTRRRGQLRGLNRRQRATVDQLTRRLVDQLLGGPITRATQLAAGPGGRRHVDLLRSLYLLEQELASPPHDPDRRQV